MNDIVDTKRGVELNVAALDATHRNHCAHGEKAVDAIRRSLQPEFVSNAKLAHVLYMRARLISRIDRAGQIAEHLAGTTSHACLRLDRKIVCVEVEKTVVLDGMRRPVTRKNISTCLKEAPAGQPRVVELEHRYALENPTHQGIGTNHVQNMSVTILRNASVSHVPPCEFCDS